MQYYRLWIYSCNSVLGVTSAIFAVFAAFVLADVRLSLLGGVELYHPTFLYAYIALLLQCGVVQAIGCYGAQRLSHKLLSVYWILLLLLTIGDVVVGLVWVFKLDRVKLSFRQSVLQDFRHKYSSDSSFTEAWNRIQGYEHCCGVFSPQDYAEINAVSSSSASSAERDLVLLPESCCVFYSNDAPSMHQTTDPPAVVRIDVNASAKVNLSTTEPAVGAGGAAAALIVEPTVPAFNTNSIVGHGTLPRHKTRHYIHHRRRLHPTPSSSTVLNGTLDTISGLYKVNLPHFQSPPTENPPETTTSVPLPPPNWLCPSPEPPSFSPKIIHTLNISSAVSNNSLVYSVQGDPPVRRRYSVYSHGCQSRLIQWLDHVSGIMFIMGFCIIGFIKACFLVILRCEIREMIEKIHHLEAEAAASPTRNQNNPSANVAANKERKESRSTFAGITIKSPPDTDDGAGEGPRLSRTDRSASHSQETVNMTLFIGNASPKAADARTMGINSGGSHRKLSWNEPYMSYFPSYGPDGERHYGEDKYIRIPNNHNAKRHGSFGMVLPPMPPKPKDLALPCNHNNRSGGLQKQRSTEHNICEILATIENNGVEQESRNEADKHELQDHTVVTTNDPYNMTDTYRRNGNNNIKTSNSFTLALIGTAV